MAQVNTAHPDQISEEQEKNGVKNDLATLQKNMDQEESLKSVAQKEEQIAADQNQQKVATAKEGSVKSKETFDSSVLDAWTAGIESPHDFNTKSAEDVLKRIESPQEHMFDIMKKEEDKKTKVIKLARDAENKNISVAEEKKQVKAAEAAKSKSDDLDWEMPKEVDEEIKDLYSDSNTKNNKDR